MFMDFIGQPSLKGLYFMFSCQQNRVAAPRGTDKGVRAQIILVDANVLMNFLAEANYYNK